MKQIKTKRSNKDRRYDQGITPGRLGGETTRFYFELGIQAIQNRRRQRVALREQRQAV